VPVSHQFHSKGDQMSPGTALSLRKPNASSTPILWNNLNAGLFESLRNSFDSTAVRG
jgi:hypothetical protein